MKPDEYERAIAGLQVEMVKLRNGSSSKLKVVVIFEDGMRLARGGCIKRITESLSPRHKVVALPAPTERSRASGCFQRYVLHLPAAGEMVLMDRSWYRGRAGVEKVMGFCTPRSTASFCAAAGIRAHAGAQRHHPDQAYWFSISNDDRARGSGSASTTDQALEAGRWISSRARAGSSIRRRRTRCSPTDIKQAPWYVVPGDDKGACAPECRPTC